MALKIQSTIKPDGSFHVAEAEDILMPDGKRLSEFKGGGADAFISSTAEISPSEIAEMVKEGRPVYITYTDSTYGVVGFSDFSFLESMSLLVASTYLNMGYGVFSVTLLGSVSKNEWGFMLEPLARQDDLPKTVNEVDITGFNESGVITEKYVEGGGNTYNFNYDEATDFTTITDSNGGKTVIKGFNPNGSSFVPEDGEDGFSPIVTVTNITGGHKVTITDKFGDKVFNVMNGTDGKNGTNGTNGKDGADGEDGFSPVVAVTNITGGHRVSITDKNGTKTFDVMDGENGEGGGSVEPLSGTTDEITPAQVYAALGEGRPVLIGYVDSTFGMLLFSSFSVAASLNYILSSFIIEYSGMLLNAVLGGNANGTAWEFNVNVLAKAGESGGAGLPEVSSTDNGKFLRVVNGAWAAAVVPSAEEASF